MIANAPEATGSSSNPADFIALTPGFRSPGSTRLTLTPWPHTSMRSASVHTITAALDALYILWYGRPMRPPMLPMLIMRRHSPVMHGTHARTIRTMPKKLVAICDSASAAAVALAHVADTVPALLTRTSIAPCLAKMARTHAATDCSSVTSSASSGCSSVLGSSIPRGQSPASTATLADGSLMAGGFQPVRDVPYTTAAGKAARRAFTRSFPRPPDAPVTRITRGVRLSRALVRLSREP
mmetsp:Transcript_13147/g.31880  ORF Transcript_13147/g.31880 Transcript_13147/m.31880 type:complete len:239 (+) Transcript_13147:609-1325(+)